MIERLEQGCLDDVLWEAFSGGARTGGEGGLIAAIAAASEASLWRDARRLAADWARGPHGAGTAAPLHLDQGPLVSIIIPTYDRPELLHQALESVASQLYRPVEAVVVNDAGTAVGDVIARFEGQIPIRLIEHTENLYLAAARNTGLRHARGYYVGYLDDDDRLYPHHVGMLVALIQAELKPAARAAVLVRRRNENGSGPDFFRPHPWRRFELADLLEENVSPVQAVLHERALVDRIGGFDPALRANEDWDFWIRLRAAVEVAESNTLTSGIDATREGRMSDRDHAAFVQAHHTIHARYHDLTQRVGGAALVERQAALRRWLEQRPQRRLDQAQEPEPPAAVLCYHRVNPEPGPDRFQLNVTPQRFCQQLDRLAERYRIVSADEFLHGAPRWDARPRLLLTFDDAYRDFYEHAWPILRQRGLPAVLFVTTGSVGGAHPLWWELLAAAGRTEWQDQWKRFVPAERLAAAALLLAELPAEERDRIAALTCDWGMLREISAEGSIEIGAHTRHHSSLGALSGAELEREVHGSLEDLEREIGRRPRMFAFPHGGRSDLSESSFETLARSGVVAAFTTLPGPIDVSARRAHGSRVALELPRVVVGAEAAEELMARLDTIMPHGSAPVGVAPHVPPADNPAKDAVPQRREPPSGRSIVVLSGISAQNLGDDAMLIATVRGLQARMPAARITVLAQDPPACLPVAGQLPNVAIVRSLQGFVAADLPAAFASELPAHRVLLAAREIVSSRQQILAGRFPKWLPTQYHEGLHLLLGADAVIDCGGANLSAHWQSYFYEKCLDYLIASRPLFVTGQGIDQCATGADEILLKTALGRASLVTLRERRSEEYLRGLRVQAPLVTTGDDALDLAPAAPVRVASLLRAAGIDHGQPYLAFQYRHYLDHADDRAPEYFAACIDAAIAGSGLPVVGVPMHFAGTDERSHLEQLVPRLVHRGRFTVVHDVLTPDEAKGLIGGAQLAFGISYHSALFALSSGVPYLGLFRGAHYEQKMRGLADLFDAPWLPLPIDETTPAQFERLVFRMLQERREHRAHLLERTAELRHAVDVVRDQFVDQLERRGAVEPPQHDPDQRLRSSAIDWGQLRSFQPVSSNWGFDRGLPVDRWYIERFLQQHSAAIRGEVAEVGGDDYTRRFGAEQVSKVDVLDINAANPKVTRVVDLNRPGGLPRRAYDALIVTQVLPHLHDPVTAVAECYAALKPGGTLLLTVPSIIRVSREPEDHWRFTTDSLERLIRDLCPGARWELQSHGNLVVALAFLIGAAAEDLSEPELAHHDPAYPVSLTAAIVKGA